MNTIDSRFNLLWGGCMSVYSYACYDTCCVLAVEPWPTFKEKDKPVDIKPPWYKKVFTTKTSWIPSVLGFLCCRALANARTATGVAESVGLNVEPLGERQSHQKQEDKVTNSYRCLSAIIVMNVTVWYVLRKPSCVRTSH